MSLDIQELSHLGLQVTDLETSLAFYIDLLGFEKLFERDYQDPRRPEAKNRIAGCGVPGGDVAFELIELDGGQKKVDGSASPVLAFGVQDLAETHRRIDASGQPILMPPTEMSPGVRMLFIQDPDGRTIECVEFASGATSLIKNLQAEAGDAR